MGGGNLYCKGLELFMEGFPDQIVNTPGGEIVIHEPTIQGSILE